MSRLDTERQRKLEPIRVEKAKNEINKLGYNIDIIGSNRIEFKYKDETVIFSPYSGWHSGKSIIDGRGLKNLLKQIKL